MNKKKDTVVNSKNILDTENTVEGLQWFAIYKDEIMSHCFRVQPGSRKVKTLRKVL